MTPQVRSVCENELMCLEAAFPEVGRIRLVWDRRPSGTAWFSALDSVITLNENAKLSVAKWKDALRHEFAHALVCSRFSSLDDGHSERWVGAAQEVGVSKKDIRESFKVHKAFRRGETIISDTWGPCEYCGELTSSFCAAHDVHFCIYCKEAKNHIDEALSRFET